MNFSKNETVVCKYKGKDLTGIINKQLDDDNYEIIAYDFNSPNEEVKKKKIELSREHIRYPISTKKKESVASSQESESVALKGSESVASQESESIASQESESVASQESVTSRKQHGGGIYNDMAFEQAPQLYKGTGGIQTYSSTQVPMNQNGNQNYEDAGGRSIFNRTSNTFDAHDMSSTPTNYQMESLVSIKKNGKDGVIKNVSHNETGEQLYDVEYRNEHNEPQHMFGAKNEDLRPRIMNEQSQKDSKNFDVFLSKESNPTSATTNTIQRQPQMALQQPQMALQQPQINISPPQQPQMAPQQPLPYTQNVLSSLPPSQHQTPIAQLVQPRVSLPLQPSISNKELLKSPIPEGVTNYTSTELVNKTLALKNAYKTLKLAYISTHQNMKELCGIVSNLKGSLLGTTMMSGNKNAMIAGVGGILPEDLSIKVIYTDSSTGEQRNGRTLENTFNKHNDTWEIQPVDSSGVDSGEKVIVHKKNVGPNIDYMSKDEKILYYEKFLREVYTTISELDKDIMVQQQLIATHISEETEMLNAHSGGSRMNGVDYDTYKQSLYSSPVEQPQNMGAQNMSAYNNMNTQNIGSQNMGTFNNLQTGRSMGDEWLCTGLKYSASVTGGNTGRGDNSSNISVEAKYNSTESPNLSYYKLPPLFDKNEIFNRVKDSSGNIKIVYNNANKLAENVKQELEAVRGQSNSDESALQYITTFVNDWDIFKNNIKQSLDEERNENERINKSVNRGNVKNPRFDYLQNLNAMMPMVIKDLTDVTNKQLEFYLEKKKDMVSKLQHTLQNSSNTGTQSRTSYDNSYDNNNNNNTGTTSAPEYSSYDDYSHPYKKQVDSSFDNSNRLSFTDSLKDGIKNTLGLSGGADEDDDDVDDDVKKTNISEDVNDTIEETNISNDYNMEETNISNDDDMEEKKEPTFFDAVSSTIGTFKDAVLGTDEEKKEEMKEQEGGGEGFNVLAKNIFNSILEAKKNEQQSGGNLDEEQRTGLKNTKKNIKLERKNNMKRSHKIKKI